MSVDILPLLSEQEDRLRYAAWTEEHGLGEFVRAFGGGYRLIGPLDVDALTAAVSGVVFRHEALRAAFPDGLYSDHQVVLAPRDIELLRTDLSGLPGNDRLAEAIRLASDQLSENLDLRSGVLFRAVLVRLGDREHLLGLSADHLVADGEAFEVILDELWRRYGAALNGERLDLPEPRFQYRDFLRWEDNWLREDPQPRASIAEAAELLDGMGLSPPVRIDGMTRDTNERYAVGAVSRTLPAETAQRFTAYCRESRTTPFNALFSVFACTVSACGGPWDVGLMIPTSRRTEEHLLDGVCMLSTYTTTRVKPDPAAPFRDLTRQARGAVMRSHRLGQVPAREVMKTLAPALLDRLFLRPSLFFDVAPSGWGKYVREVGELTIEPAPVPIRVRHIENVSMFASASPEEVRFTMFYPADVFEAQAMTRFAGRFVDMVDRCVREPLSPVGKLVG